jgi:hypothetical protein
VCNSGGSFYVGRNTALWRFPRPSSTVALLRTVSQSGAIARRFNCCLNCDHNRCLLQAQSHVRITCAFVIAGLDT